ncbi:MAG: TraU family protein [Alteromonadaceae bacterium]|nr:TraU family protein [Alteromonadaceae bacterium]
MKTISFLLLLLSFDSLAICRSQSIINPISDVTWQCMFPMVAAGLVMNGGNDDNASGTSKSAICNCFSEGIPKVGIPFSFWEPSTMIDVVTDAGCTPAMGGLNLLGGGGYNLDGKKSDGTSGVRQVKKQVHYISFPVLKLLDMFYDLPCIRSEEEYDYLMISEILPYWQNDLLSTIIFPETVLFANPAAQLACTADAVALLTGMGVTSDILYWCLGGTGTTYPISGAINSSDEFQASAAFAARSVFMMGRVGSLIEYNKNGCSSQRQYIWNKSRYKYHLAKPVVVPYCTPFGQNAMLQPPGINVDDNKTFIIFRKVDCCTFGD